MIISPLEQLEEFRKTFKLTTEMKHTLKNININSPHFIKIEQLMSDMSEFINYFYWCYRKNGSKLD